MKYLSTSDIGQIPYSWNRLIDDIYTATHIVRNGQFKQPIKQYLRYNDDLQNRIIAMPAYIGQEVDVAGIKWIASFPGNIDKAMSRAHSTIILNNAQTGQPFAILNASQVSAIRTASITGAFVRKYLELKKLNDDASLTVAISGFGPIGQFHVEMFEGTIGHLIREYLIYDIRSSVQDSLSPHLKSKTRFTDSWQDAFSNADIFSTCTVCTSRYIDLHPKRGSLHLNISLRDYQVGFSDHVDVMVVDNWEEVCRENTDIERMHIENGLSSAEVVDLPSFLFDHKSLDVNDVVMFNPMGMAVYDLVIAKHLYDSASRLGLGVDLPN